MKFFMAFLAIGFAGCSQMQYMEVPEYKITKNGPFILSESPELWKVFDRSLSKTERRLNFLITNKDSKPHSLFLNQASLTINMEKKAISCQNIARPMNVLVMEQDQVSQIQCKLEISPNKENQLANRDSLVKLEIPTDSGVTVAIERIFRIEEFR
ncbi:hypothetical protein ACNH6C_07895 [Bdellovibrio bacteriovorus]|uniref:hypothetical protein n=1 Tax=Bdellovibrio bacteriovorus TaxID=959 RepID=UPI003A8127DD